MSLRRRSSRLYCYRRWSKAGPKRWRGCSRERTSDWSRGSRAGGACGHGADPGRAAPAVREALIAQGISLLYSHQADAWETVMRRGNTIVTTGTASGKSLCFNLPVLHVLTLIRARGRSTSTRPRRSRRTRRAASPSWARPPCTTRSTTATHRRRSAPRSASAPTWCSRTPTCCTSGSCPTTPPGVTSSPTWRSWSWTRRTCTAACSARMSRTCCAACGGWRAPTGPRRASCSRRRRSPTRCRSPRS